MVDVVVHHGQSNADGDYCYHRKGDSRVGDETICSQAMPVICLHFARFTVAKKKQCQHAEGRNASRKKMLEPASSIGTTHTKHNYQLSFKTI
ncbi:hypothetical protein NECAME_07532 [Necator americanus]|uniref:Uncharacterized protein n=1 Tax=Necator americanus TaxID=51031 RepID=W2TQ63_NECAM|nr:hypothetical protein NECAME_07532 [Necator americanus]ETN83172.1 hypothetical protein NECAME_07532 [Necator americanus]